MPFGPYLRLTMTAKKDKAEAAAGLGRYELIERLSEKSGIRRGGTAFGSNTIAGSNGLLISHDIMVEGTDFSLVYFPLKHLGYKLVVRTLAGIYASAGKPSDLIFTLAMSSRFGEAQASEIIDGIGMASGKYGVQIRYFDLISSVTGLTLACTAWGYSDTSAPAAAPPAVNDLVCVTGDLGAAFTGLRILERERRIFESGAIAQPDLSEYEYTIGRQLKPELKIKVLDEMRHRGIIPSATTVVREGLASEAIGLCRERGKGCRLYYDKIPVDSATERNASEINTDPVVAALNGGDDYEFLFFIPISQVEAVNGINDLRMVGYLTEPSEGCRLVTPDGSLVDLSAQGWVANR